MNDLFKDRVLLIDTDTASDDAVALMMALASPRVHVAAITTVAGNVDVEQATRNALFTVELCAKELGEARVPVYKGADMPLRRALQMAHWFHGADGMGDHGYAPVRREAEEMHAVDAILQTVAQYPGLEIITLGPLTNLAMALERDPEIAKQISRCVMMGGAPCCEGNVTPAAEFNMWVDPDAARIVFRSGMPIEMIGWQLSRGAAVLNAEEMESIVALGTERARVAMHCNSTALKGYEEQTGEHGLALPDPVAMAVLLQPELNLISSAHYVEIETQSELTRGMTVVDRLEVSGDARNSSLWVDMRAKGQRPIICWELDVSGWKRALLDALR